MAVLAAEQEAKKMEAAGPDVLALLRSATRARHERLDSALPLAGANPTLEDYCVHLRVLAAWRACIAPWIARTGSTGQQALDAALQADLADGVALGCTTASSAVGCDASGLRASDDGSAAYAWGVAYVLEGSMLGGLSLHRALAQRLAPHPLRYLAGHGADAGARWREFLARLEPGAAGDASSAAAGACAAFDALSAAFGRTGVLR